MTTPSSQIPAQAYHSMSPAPASREAQLETGVYKKRPLQIVRGSGALLEDTEGRQYIDCAAGIGVANIGHAHPRIVEALARQAARLMTCPELFYNDTRAAYLERLVAALPAGLDRVFLCNSGTESVEAALKFARLATPGGAR